MIGFIVLSVLALFTVTLWSVYDDWMKTPDWLEAPRVERLP